MPRNTYCLSAAIPRVETEVSRFPTVMSAVRSVAATFVQGYLAPYCPTCSPKVMSPTASMTTGRTTSVPTPSLLRSPTTARAYLPGFAGVKPKRVPPLPVGEPSRDGPAVCAQLKADRDTAVAMDDERHSRRLPRGQPRRDRKRLLHGLRRRRRNADEMNDQERLTRPQPRRRLPAATAAAASGSDGSARIVETSSGFCCGGAVSGDCSRCGAPSPALRDRRRPAVQRCQPA